MTSKCKFCNKELNSDAGLMAHFNDKHKADKGSLSINELKKRSIGGITMLAIAAIACCGILTLLGLGGIGFLSFLAVQHTQTSGVQTAGSQSTYGVANATVGELAPNIPITLTNGTSITLGDLRGKPVVLWLVTTWCSSCQEGEHILTSGGYYSAIRSKGANIIIIELYNDLGQPGPSIQSFADQYGNGTQNPGLLYGISNLNATYSYDPKGYLEIYYIINPNGTIAASGAPLSTNLNGIVQSV
ncbi:MAG: redoxin domain-containing protein [Candidatus Micrarchaeia archaeon]